MMLRRTAIIVIALSVTGLSETKTEQRIPGTSPTPSAIEAQTESTAEGRVAAELVKGKLNPATSKPGDRVAIRLQEDAKSNGQVILKKGTEITGVVRNVKRLEDTVESGKGTQSQSSFKSMMQVEWLLPPSSGTASSDLSLALQSIAYTSPLYAQEQEDVFAPGTPDLVFPPAVPTPPPGSSGGGLLRGGLGGQVLGGVTSSVGTIGSVGSSTVGGALGNGSAASAGVLAKADLRTSGNPLPIDAKAASYLHSNFGVSGPLFLAGNGSVVSSNGTMTSMDIYSHVSNDAVIASPSKNFEIGGGAQMQFIVNTRRSQ